MKYVVNILIKNKLLSETISKKYIPHLTLVYPFSKYSKEEIISHIKKSLNGVSKFEILLKGLQKSKKGYYLYLLVNKNKRNIINLHKKIHSGILKGVNNKDMPLYIPHISLGNFQNKKDFDDFKAKIKKLNLKVAFQVSKITLLELNEKDQIKSTKHFKLK